jgi:hypothetical protein
MKRVFWVVFTIVTIFALLLFILQPWLIRQLAIEEHFRSHLQKMIGYAPDFKHLKISLTPFPKIELNSFRITDMDSELEIPLFDSDTLSFHPKLLPFILRQSVELAKIQMNGANVNYPWRNKSGTRVKTISVRDLKMNLQNVRTRSPIKFDLSGSWLSDTPNVSAKGLIETDFEKTDFKTSRADIEFKIDPLQFSEFASWWGNVPVLIHNGVFSIEGTIRKESTMALEAKVVLQLKNFIYEIPNHGVKSETANYAFSFSFHYDLETKDLKVTKGQFDLPYGAPVFIETVFNTKRLEISEFLLNTESVNLESLPHFLLPLTDLLPINLGFSGNSKVDLFLKGTPEALSVNFRLGLDEAILSYAKYFSKPSNMPLSLQSDFKLLAGSLIRGDFTVEFDGAAAKGSIVGVDLKSGIGEVTVLTNKFKITGWEKYFPLIKEFQLQGESKLLASVQGNLTDAQKMKLMTNVTLDQISVGAHDVKIIEALNGSFDLSHMDSEISDVRFRIGESLFRVEGKTFGQPTPRTLMGIKSEVVHVYELLQKMRVFNETLAEQGLPLDWLALENLAEKWFGKSDTIQNLLSRVALEQDRIMVPDLSFDLFNGRIQLQAIFELMKEKKQNHFEVKLDHINLSLLQKNMEKPLVDGNLFSKIILEGNRTFDDKWLNQLKGSGTFSVTNGEFHTVDVLAGLARVSELSLLRGFGTSATRFSDFTGSFVVSESSISTEDLLIVADDFQVKGKGDIGLDGELNLRLSVYLSEALSQRIVPNIGSRMRLGPIPIIVLGTLSKPSLRTDPMLIGAFLENFAAQRFFNISSQLKSKLPTTALLPAHQDKNAVESTHMNSKSTTLHDALAQGGYDLLKQFLTEKKVSP